MKVTVIKESGYKEALFGLGLSYGLTSNIDEPDEMDAQLLDKLHKIACKLAKKGNGEDKFLRQMSVWISIQAPLYWWKEADQYRVGCTTQSESTMHTLANNPITIDCFETTEISFVNKSSSFNEIIERCEEKRQKYHALKKCEHLDAATQVWRELVAFLPSSWLQRRIWSANYAVLRNILSQRKGHKLPEWTTFIDYTLGGVDFPEFLEM